MSLILEALRKSEAERRRGLPPDLHAELPPAQAPRNARTRVWLAAGAAVLVVSCTIWWLQRDDVPQRTRQPAAVNSQPVAPQVYAHAEEAQAPTLPARTAAASAIHDLREDADTAPPRASSAAPATRPPIAPVSGERPAAAVTASPPVVTPPDPARPLSLADLDPGTRKALPPLKLSMHLWNDDPARRAVILDGHRLVEGDRVGELLVRRIERDGVLLDWNGRALRLPLR